MKLSDARIKALSKKIAREAVARQTVTLKVMESQLADLVQKAISKDQMMVEAIDEEARALIARQKSLPPPGSPEYQAAFQQARRTVAIRKGFPL